MENHNGGRLGKVRAGCSTHTHCFTKILLIFLLATGGCAAVGNPQPQPAIDELTGNVEVGETLLVTGARFADADHGTVISDAGDAIRILNGEKIAEMAAAELWDKLGSPWAEPLERISEDERQAQYRGKGKSYNGYLKALEDSGNGRLFVSWRLKLSDSPGHSKGSNKFIRIWDKTNGKGTRISWTQMHMTYNGSKKPSWGGWPGKAMEWNQMSLWVDSEAGVIQARVNDKVAHHVNDFKKVDTDKGLNIKLIGFDPNRSTPYKDMEVEIDDLYVAATPARVVVSDEPKWAQAQNRQSIQIPTAWRDNEIRFVYEPADYLKDKRYLYVVNKQGEANPSGFPVNKAGAPAPGSAPRD